MIKAFIDYRRDLAAERDNARHENLEMRDSARVQSVADEFLSKRSGYYTQSSNLGKIKFRQRLLMVMTEREFYGNDSLKVTDEMVVLILAIGGAYFTRLISSTVAIIAGALALVFAATSFISFYPLYLPFGLNTLRSKAGK